MEEWGRGWGRRLTGVGVVGVDGEAEDVAAALDAGRVPPPVRHVPTHRHRLQPATISHVSSPSPSSQAPCNAGQPMRAELELEKEATVVDAEVEAVEGGGGRCAHNVARGFAHLELDLKEAASWKAAALERQANLEIFRLRGLRAGQRNAKERALGCEAGSERLCNPQLLRTHGGVEE